MVDLSNLNPEQLAALNQILTLLTRGQWSGGCLQPAVPVGRNGSGNGRRRLNGFPNCVGDAVVFPFDVTIAASGSEEIVLDPREPVFLYGMITTDPAAASVLRFTAFNYAGDQAYPDGGKNSAGITRLPRPESFTAELIEAKANPWPKTPMVCDNARNLELVISNPSGASVDYVGFIFGALADTSHPEWESYCSKK